MLKAYIVEWSLAHLSLRHNPGIAGLPGIAGIQINNNGFSHSTSEKSVPNPRSPKEDICASAVPRSDNLRKSVAASPDNIMSEAKITPERKAAYDLVAKAGWPLLESFKALPTALLTAFVKKEMVLAEKFDYVSDLEKEVIWTVVSSVNNCELCLSFHGMTLVQKFKVSKEEAAEIVAGGLPKDKNLRNIAIATRYGIAHKGPLLEREWKHLEALGLTKPKIMEIIFLAGQMDANNKVFVNQIASGIKVEEMLQACGPFAETVYKKST